MSLLKAFNPNSDEAQPCYTSAGFMADVHGPRLIIIGHTVLERNTPSTQLHKISIHQIEEHARHFATHRSPEDVFKRAREVSSVRDSLGFVCYTMHRRLIRLDQGSENPNYDLPLNVEKLETLIADCLYHETERISPFRKPEHRDIPVASIHDLVRYELVRSKPEPAAA